MKVYISLDDGCKEDLKMAELLRKYEMPAIFFIPTVAQLSEDDIRRLADDFEIGGHTSTHPPDIKRLSNDDVFAEVSDNRQWLRSVTGQEVEWFCYPRGRHNESVRNEVKRAGFSKARTTWVNNFKEAEDLLVIHPTVHVHRMRKEYNGVPWLDHAMQLYTIAKNSENSFYHIWGHSWEIEQQGTWGELEELFAYIRSDLDNGETLCVDCHKLTDSYGATAKVL